MMGLFSPAMPIAFSRETCLLTTVTNRAIINTWSVMLEGRCCGC